MNDLLFTSRFLCDQDYRLDVCANMKKYGGSFVKILSELIIVADSENLAKIAITFSEYISEYLPEKWEKRTK